IRAESLSSNSFARGDFWSGSSKTIFSVICFFLVAISFFISFLLAILLKRRKWGAVVQQNHRRIFKADLPKTYSKFLPTLMISKDFSLAGLPRMCCPDLDSRIGIERKPTLLIV